MTELNPGALDRRATIQKRVQVGEGSLGDPIYEWQTRRVVWTQVVYRAEDEKFAAEQRYAVRTVTFRTRWFSGLEATDKIVFEGATYDVKGWREIGRRAGLEIAAEAQS